MRGAALRGLQGAAREAQASLNVEVSPDGHVLLLLKSDDFPEPAVFGFTPGDAERLAKTIREAARDAEVRRRV